MKKFYQSKEDPSTKVVFQNGNVQGIDGKEVPFNESEFTEITEEDFHAAPAKKAVKEVAKKEVVHEAPKKPTPPAKTPHKEVAKKTGKK